MRVSRYALQSYNIPDDYFFATRTERDSYFLGKNIDKGTMCAVGGDRTSTDWSSSVWEADQFNGSNWATLDLSQNFALVVTNDGIAALSNASVGQYKLELSRILIKSTPIQSGDNLANWTLTTFKQNPGYGDICLDTNNLNNSTFSLERNLTYRTNMLNGGIQFTIQLGVNCMGQNIVNDTDSPNEYPTLTEFDVAAIGLCVKDQREGQSGDVLFAIANLPVAVTKLASTPNRVGNDLKFYLNTTLSNFGNVVNLDVFASSVNSVPEVISEDDLAEYYDGENAPYNLYIVDNLADTNIPAIAVRKGNPTTPTNPITWTYFTPTDDTVYVQPDLISPALNNYMMAAWHKDTGESGDQSWYVPADSESDDDSLTGMYNKNHIIYAGKIINVNAPYAYTFNMNTATASGYQAGDQLKAIDDITGAVFYIMISRVDTLSGEPIEWTISPTVGNVEINATNLQVVYSGIVGEGTDLKLSISSSPQTSDTPWNFPSSWTNKPLYVDYNHPISTPLELAEWNAYLAATDLPSDTNPDRRGLLTILPKTGTEGMFVGWCINPTTVKLALDLRNEATDVTYGTTRYATNDETSDVTSIPTLNKNKLSITPKRLQDNYIQKTAVNGNPGYDWNNPITVDTCTKFTKTIVGRGITNPDTNMLNNANLSFYGLAYRAWWEDLAEYYKSDKLYPAGTLICIGAGLAEITEAKSECNGIISTKPGYELGKKEDAFDLPVALVGKVPVLFDGNCSPKFGDRVYLSKIVPGRASTTPFGKCLGKIIDRRKNLDQVNNIMCSVRIDF